MANSRGLSPLSFVSSLQKGPQMPCQFPQAFQQDLYHIFIDFKKAFDTVWHAALWATMKKYIISTNPILVIKYLHNKATSAVL